MGYTKHHAIIVTSWDREVLRTVHARATSVFGRQVSNICEPIVNHNETFLIGPDGSYEDWDESDSSDQSRFEFIAYLEGFCYEDGSSMIKWVELSYGDDKKDPQIINFK